MIFVILKCLQKVVVHDTRLLLNERKKFEDPFFMWHFAIQECIILFISQYTMIVKMRDKVR